MVNSIEKGRVEDMKVKGRYMRDHNFTTIYTGDRVYTVARATGEWSSVGVGERTYMGNVLTQERYNAMEADCHQEGEFELS